MGRRRSATYQRQEEIKNLVRTGVRRVDEIAEIVGVSPSTVRRDLMYLEDEGKVTRTLGGALPGLNVHERALSERESVAVVAKAAIGAAAAGLLPKNATTVFVDAGSTCAQVLPHLRARGGLTVVTRGLEIALALADEPNVDVIVVGGKVYRKSHGLAGVLTTQALERLYVDMAFLGCDGVHPTNGVGEPTMDEAHTKGAVAVRAGSVVVLAHAEKLTSPQAAWAPLPPGWTLVTDEASATVLAPYTRAGVQVITARPEDYSRAIGNAPTALRAIR